MTAIQQLVDLDKNKVTEKDDKPHCKESLIRPHLNDYGSASNLAFNEAVHKMMAEGRNIYHFAFGQSPFPPVEGAKKVLAENANETAYLPVAGLSELRASICSFHEKRDGLRLQDDLVVVGPGSKELIYLLINVFNGDILLLSPSWTTYKPQTQLANQRVFTIKTTLEDNWKLTPFLLEQTLQQHELKRNRLLILCNPDNPTGTAYSEEDFIALSSALRKHNIIVLSDEIYAATNFECCHKTLAKYYPEGTVLSSGISKWASAGGWRLGYSIYPPELKVLHKAVRSAASHTYSCASGPVQHAAVWLFRFDEECERYVYHTSKILQAVAAFCHRELTSVGVKAIMPRGGFYIFPDFEVIREALARRNITTGEAMCKALLEEADVAVMSGGPAFLRPDDEFTVRLCYINFDGAFALKASQQHSDEPITDDFLNLYCKPVVEGILAIKNWVQKQLESGK
ncbi:aspartate aminotransferase-like [Lytechinus variegatus]|uniref:aspartate aminotransferase-like n=1 Tax=Lytechinus variegatus TaxID=7654 RepID=UPI001BB10C6D|nr:aspartate aminotransferase-like [Lytechinus variegatus]XP_041459086.1 aspartate aminotransferase-like [Lytechinus variegatus]